MKLPDYLFRLDMKVRDYECDLQGVVNNANYQHYMEHCRHEYFESLGENFAEMHANGIDAYVYRISITYKTSLHSGDTFFVGMNIKRKGPKIVFMQDVVRTDGVLAARAEVDIVIVKDGQVTRGEFFDKYFA